MAVATPAAYTAASGQRVYGGRFPETPPVGSFPAVPTTGLVIGSVLAPAAGTLPVCMGAAFRQGEFASGTTFSGVQCTVKNLWPDGSIKFALLAFGPGVAANTLRPIGLTAGAAPSGAALTTTQLRGFMTAPVTITAGAFGSASWSGADWDAPFAWAAGQTAWASGPLMSSWIYRKPIGSDAHLVAWLEVRLFVDGSVEVLPWVENGYIDTLSPTNKNATYTFTLGGTSRFSADIDLKHRTRTPLLNGSILSHWLSTDPGVTAVHDTAYLQATELVPTYRATLNAGDSNVTTLPTTYTPLGLGSFLYDGGSANMAASGYQPAIGVLPMHDMLYLVANSADKALVSRSIQRNGYAAGQFSIHYRDENTNRPLRFSQRGDMGINDSQGIKDNGSAAYYAASATGGNGALWDMAHCPSVGFMAYLLTGRFYFMEEVQFAATINAVTVMRQIRSNNNTGGYTNASCLIKPAVQVVQTRAVAWGLRTLAQALCVTPSTDSLYPDLLFSVEENLRYYHNTYVVQANNPYGMIAPGENPYSGNTRLIAPWQQDFVTAAVGYAKCLGLPLSPTGATRLSEFFAWKAKSIVFRLGPSSAFWYINANPYTVAISSANFPNYEGGTGPWYATDAEVYTATYTPAPSPDFRSTTEGVLGFDYGTAAEAAKALWANIQPAIAYAVRHGVAGAVAAYSRMVGATNWASFVSAQNVRPVWAVQPASGLSPAWIAGKAVNEWGQIPGTTSPAELKDFSGVALREEAGLVELFSGATGGHGGNLTNNRVMAQQLDVDAPAWVQRRAASDPTGTITTFMPAVFVSDGRPTPRHTYTQTYWVPEIGRYYVRGRYFGSEAGDPASTATFNPATGVDDWDVPSTRATFNQAAFYQVRDPATGIWYGLQGGQWNPNTDTFSGWTITGGATLARQGGAFAPSRGYVFQIFKGDNWDSGAGNTVRAATVTIPGGVSQAITFNPSAALTDFAANAPNIHLTTVYNPDLDVFYAYGGNTGQTAKVYVITPNAGTTWDMALLPVTGLTPPVSNGGNNDKLKYISRWKTLVLIADDANIHFVRTA